MWGYADPFYRIPGTATESADLSQGETKKGGGTEERRACTLPVF